MTREEVKKELVDVFKDFKVEELENNITRIRIEIGVITRVFYLYANSITFMFYIKTDYSLMSNTIANVFSYSQIKWIEETQKGIRFVLEDATLIDIDF